MSAAHPSMPTARSERPRSSPRRVRAAALVSVCALLAGLLTGCSLLGDADEPTAAATGGPAGSAGSAEPGLPAPPDVVAGLRRALDRRAEAVRTGDRRTFLAGVARRAPQVQRQQAVYFDNLSQLPLAQFSYAFDRRDVVRDGDAYWVVVDVSMQLAGYDAEPVVSRDRYRYEPAPRRSARMLLHSVTDAAWEAEHGVDPQPWDLGPIEVRGGYGVLGVFDPDSLAAAPAVITSIERGISEVSAVVPYDWRRTVVVYALSSTAFLETIDDLPGGDPAKLDGVAFPVQAAPGVRRTAATRFALHPRMLTRTGRVRDRLVRHELVHVALGDRDDDAPVWLSEGIAEYVSVRPVDRAERVVAAAALDRAQAGVDGLPTDDSFTDPDPEPVVSYGLSWWICEYVADAFGESSLWSLLDATNDRDADVDRVIRELLGLSPGQLARRGARQLVATFAPERMPSTTPSQLPTVTPSGSPSPEGRSGSPSPDARRSAA